MGRKDSDRKIKRNQSSGSLNEAFRVIISWTVKDKKITIKGFALDRERAREAGRKGGLRSRRNGVKNAKQNTDSNSVTS